MRRLAELAARQRGLRALLGAADAAALALRQPRPAPDSLRSLLLLRRRSLGDLILLLPALRQARALFPGVRLTLMTDAVYAPFLREARLGLEVWPVRSWRTIGWTAAAGFDAALAFHADPRMLFAVRRHARWLAGYAAPGNRCLLDCVLPYQRDQEVARSWCGLVEALAGQLSCAAAPAPGLARAQLELAPAWRAAAAAFWPAAQSAPVIVHPGCGTASKRWDPESWRGLLARCRNQGWPVLLTGNAREAALCAALAAGGPGPGVVTADPGAARGRRPGRPRSYSGAAPAGGGGTRPAQLQQGEGGEAPGKDRLCLNLAGHTSLGALAGLVAAARAVVAPDTGIIHLARALGTPTVALFGPNSPEIWGAEGLRGGAPLHRSLVHPLACSYCECARCSRLPARSQAVSPCLHAIGLGEVWRALATVVGLASGPLLISGPPPPAVLPAPAIPPHGGSRPCPAPLPVLR